MCIRDRSYSLRTNVIGLATTNLNLEASMTLNRKWSLHLPVHEIPVKDILSNLADLALVGMILFLWALSCQPHSCLLYTSRCV